MSGVFFKSSRSRPDLEGHAADAEAHHGPTDDIPLNDNVKVLLGTGNDAEIFYDGTDLHINPAAVGSGSLRIGAAVNLQFNDLGGVKTIALRNPADTFEYALTPAAIAADRQLNLPVLTGTSTLAVLELAQTFTAQQTLSALLVTGNVGFYNTTPVAQPNVPLTSPTVQNVIDALVTLGLVEQSD